MELDKRTHLPVKSILKTLQPKDSQATSAPTSPGSDEIKTATKQLTRMRSMSLPDAQEKPLVELKPLRANRYYRANNSKLCTIC